MIWIPGCISLLGSIKRRILTGYILHLQIAWLTYLLTLSISLLNKLIKSLFRDTYYNLATYLNFIKTKNCPLLQFAPIFFDNYNVIQRMYFDRNMKQNLHRKPHHAIIVPASTPHTFKLFNTANYSSTPI
jgi:hypothetical protein